MEKAQGTKPTLAQVHAPTRVVVAPLHRSADDALRRAGGGRRRRCRPAFPRAESEGTAAVGRAGPPQRPTTRPETGSARRSPSSRRASFSLFCPIPKWPTQFLGRFLAFFPGRARADPAHSRHRRTRSVRERRTATSLSPTDDGLISFVSWRFFFSSWSLICFTIAATHPYSIEVRQVKEWKVPQCLLPR